MKKEPQTVIDALFHLSSFLAKIGNAYRNAGVDYITIHEMGGSPGLLVRKVRAVCFARIERVAQEFTKSRVLSVCGNVSKSFER